DAVLAPLAELQRAERQLLQVSEAEQKLLDAALVREARSACRAEGGELLELVGLLGQRSVQVRLLADHATTHMLNSYFDVEGRGIGIFAVDERLQSESRRWAVLRLLLEDLGCASRVCHMVEVGVSEGQTSLHLLDSLPLLRLHGVDPYQPCQEYPRANAALYEEVKRRLAQFQGRAVLYRNTSRFVAEDIMQSIGSPADLVFVDGSHKFEAVAEDLAIWAPRTHRLAGHDLNLVNGEVADALFQWSAGREPVHLLPDA
ncbi:unnamed protein product, partial [Polarella glacialis]